MAGGIDALFETRAQVGSTIQCCDCGKEIIKVWTAHKRCDGCRIRRQREKNERWNRSRGCRPLGSHQPCRRCGAEFALLARGTKYCSDCAAAAKQERYRRAAEKKARAAGVQKVKGTVAACALCGSDYVRKVLRQKFCSDCGPVRWKKCPTKRLSVRLGNAIRKSLTAKAKRRRDWEELVGYTAEELRVHLERQFLKDMSWANYGDWHIDHILPLSRFKYEKPEDPEFKAAWALTNLRPLWGIDNLKKSNRATFLL